MSKSKHVATWFEIPVTDMARACAFYGKVFDCELSIMEGGPVTMAVFPVESSEDGDVVHGALVRGEGYTPSDTGTLLYLNGGEDLTHRLSRVEAAGGSVIQHKMAIGEHGFIGLFMDSEGNRLAMHSAG